MDVDRSPTQAFAHKTLFLTGGTGFFAKAIIEKLMRSAPDVGKIYVLIRPRKGQSPSSRLEKDIIASPIFDRLRSERSDAETFIRSKLVAVAGDVTSPQLGLSADDQRVLRQRVHIAIHSAANVRFNEPLNETAEMNCVGALRVLDFVQSLPLLQCYMHVSTAFVNSNLRIGDRPVHEKLYPLAFDPEEALAAIMKASPAELEKLTDNLMGKYPHAYINTYALAKSMAEHLLTKRARSDLPLIIFRPAGISASWKEPVPGWVDQIAGVGNIFVNVGKGVLTILPGDPNNNVDAVPLDLTVNTALVAIAAMTGQRENVNAKPLPHPFIVHSGTSDPRQSPIPWQVPAVAADKYFRKYPLKQAQSPAKFQIIADHEEFQAHWDADYAKPLAVASTLANKNASEHHMREAARLKKKTTRARTLVEVYKKFTENQWIFSADSLAILEQFTDPQATEWWLDVSQIEWEPYMFNYIVGLKKYVLHEDVSHVDEEDVNRFAHASRLIKQLPSVSKM